MDRKPTDRRTLLDQRDKAYRLANNQDLPDEVRNLAKQAGDKADVLLGLDDARLRAYAKPDRPPVVPKGPLRPLPDSISSDGLRNLLAKLRTKPEPGEQ